MFMQSHCHSVKGDLKYQYAVCRSPLYCLMDTDTLDTTGWNFWDDMDGSLDAPECLPVGCSHGRDKNGSRVFKNFTWREWEEAQRREIIAQKLIDEMKAEGLL
jgi:hypothetical protein